MGSPENFALRWNDFHSNISSMFKHMRSSPEFQDVTLLCGIDSDEIKAHKVILSACSGYFQSVLSRTDAPHPVILMPKDVQYEEIAGIIDFMYYGEVEVPTQDISRFLAVAEQFQVRGLVEDVPKFGAVSSSRYQSKRPRLIQEQEKETFLEDGEDSNENYQPFGAPKVVGLVCPRCRKICKGPTNLKAHMATCGVEEPYESVSPNMSPRQKPHEQVQGVRRDHGQSRPMQHVAPAPRGRGNLQPPGQGQRLVRGAPGGPSQQHNSQAQRPMPMRPQPVRGRPGGPGARGMGRPPRLVPRADSQPPSRLHPPSHPGPGGRPNLTQIGQKLGLAVSITSVGNEGDNVSGLSEEAVHNTLPSDSNDVHVKEEPDTGHEIPDENVETGEYSEVMDDGGDNYENQFDDDFDAAADLGEDYVTAGDNYPGYDEYDDGGDTETDATSKK